MYLIELIWMIYAFIFNLMTEIKWVSCSFSKNNFKTQPYFKYPGNKQITLQENIQRPTQQNLDQSLEYPIIIIHIGCRIRIKNLLIRKNILCKLSTYLIYSEYMYFHFKNYAVKENNLNFISLEADQTLFHTTLFSVISNSCATIYPTLKILIYLIFSIIIEMTGHILV